MPGIFISYRRVDGGWAGRLFDELRKRFGRKQVFMDVEGGIPRGAKFEEVLQDALSSCDALLALIGPRWLECKRPDGRRSLDVPDDWVRNEIASALQRDIAVIPILFGKTSVPDEAYLPEVLRPLRKRQFAEISDSEWNHGVGELVKVLAKIIPLTDGSDITSVNSGIRLLQELINDVPQVADAVSRSREVIENTYRQVQKLGIFKEIHDSLHTIEFECLWPMQKGGAPARPRPFKIRFAAEMRRIQECLGWHGLNPALRDDILDELERANESLQKAIDDPGNDSFSAAVSELTVLVSSLPSRLNQGIADAAGDLNLGRLVDLMATLRGKLESAGAGDDELDLIVDGIDALGRLRDELRSQASEHSQLQRLDSKLRTVCDGEAGVASLAGEWTRIKRLRSQLAPPYSFPLEAASSDLAVIEGDIDAAVAQSDDETARDLIGEYFRSVSTVFREVDKELNRFCHRLSEVNQGLETVLRLC